MALLSIKNITEENWEVIDNQTLYLSVLSESINVPDGFVIPSEVFEYVIERLGIKKKIDNLVRVMNPADEARLQEIANEIQKLIIKCELPDDVKEAILEAYDSLGINEDVSLKELTESENMPLVELQSSPVNYNDEEIFIYNINSQEKLIEGVLSCFGLHYAGKRLKYRLTNGIEDKGVSVTIKKSLNPYLSGIGYIEGNGLVLKAVYGHYNEAAGVCADTYHINSGGEITSVNKCRQPFIENYSKTENKLVKNETPSHLIEEQKLNEENLIKLSQMLRSILGKLSTGFYVNFAIQDQKFYINSVLYNPAKPQEGHSGESFSEMEQEKEDKKEPEQESQAINQENISFGQQQDGGSIFSMFKEQEKKNEPEQEKKNELEQEKQKTEIAKPKKNGEDLVTAARHSLGQVVVHCDMAITKRLQQEYKKMFDDDSLTDMQDLLAVLSRERDIPSIDDLREIREIRNRYIETMKTPSIPEVKYVFDKTRNFFNDF
ncbi:MAG: PEP/pyruvate-binding domain-containing protein [Nanoarchaeota archaeon]